MNSQLNPLTLLRKHLPTFASVREQPIVTSNGTEIGWNTHLLETCGSVIASGTHTDRQISRQIAVAECLERKMVDRIASDEALRTQFALDVVNSTSGFAAGFANSTTKFRAICEGLERWAWSQWIDNHYEMNKVEVPLSRLSPIALQLQTSFDSVEYYYKEIPVVHPLLPKLQLVFAVVLGYTGEGVFAGSRVTGLNDDLWSHGIIEAYRNLVNSQIYKQQSLTPPDWYMRRVMFFSNNRKSAEHQIGLAIKPHWLKPDLWILDTLDISDPFFLWRCLFKNFVPWHLGPDHRFVY